MRRVRESSPRDVERGGSMAAAARRTHRGVACCVQCGAAAGGHVVRCGTRRAASRAERRTRLSRADWRLAPTRTARPQRAKGAFCVACWRAAAAAAAFAAAFAALDSVEISFLFSHSISTLYCLFYFKRRKLIFSICHIYPIGNRRCHLSWSREWWTFIVRGRFLAESKPQLFQKFQTLKAYHLLEG